MKSAAVQLSFLSDGDRTVVEAAYHSYHFPSVYSKASSGREPGDKSNERIGEALAAARVLRSLAAKLERQATGAMRHAETNRQHAEEIRLRGPRLPRGTGGRLNAGWYDERLLAETAVAKSMDRRG